MVNHPHLPFLARKLSAGNNQDEASAYNAKPAFKQKSPKRLDARGSLWAEYVVEGVGMQQLTPSRRLVAVLLPCHPLSWRGGYADGG